MVVISIESAVAVIGEQPLSLLRGPKQLLRETRLPVVSEHIIYGPMGIR